MNRSSSKCALGIYYYYVTMQHPQTDVFCSGLSQTDMRYK